MSDSEFKFKSKFVSKASILKPSEDILKEAKASLLGLKGIFPIDIDPETDPDIVYIIANLAVAGVLNLNDDGLSIEESISVYKKFEKKQTNLEHDRTQIVGYILKAGLSEFGTNRPLSEEEAKTSNKPFNIVAVIAVWKVAAKELCEFLLDKATEEGNLELSLSFEVGFDKYQIIELSENSIDFNDAEKIIYENSPEFNSYDASLKQNGGTGKKNGNKIGRSLCGKVVPLGAGIVTVPAANVKGLLPITNKTTDIITTENTSANPFATSPTQPFSVPAKMKIIKLSDTKAKEFEAKYTYIDTNNNKNLTVVLKSGKRIKLANYDKGYLEVPEDQDFEEADIMCIDPSKTADQTHIDNSTIVHPKIDQVFPNSNEETQKKNEEFEKQREDLRNKAYKDASGKLLELLAELQKSEKIFNSHKTNIENSVLNITTNKNTMNLKEIQAKVTATNDPVELKECVANAILFAEAISKKSEEMEAATADHKKLMEDAIKHKMEAENLHANVKKEMEALKHKLSEMEEGHKASEAERKFNARMSKLEADYDMDEGSRAVVSKKMAAMSDEDYASYEMDLKALMKEKSKHYKQELSEKLKASLKHEEEEAEGKKKHKDSFEAKKAKEDEDEAEAALALASAKANIIDKDLDNAMSAAGKSLKEQFAEAFGGDVKIAGETVSALNEKIKNKNK
jgi:hypothetical protein